MNPKQPKNPKLEVVKSVPKTFEADELMDIWSSEGNMEMVLIVGIPKGGGWKYAASKGGGFEFLASAEALIQKWKLDLLELKPKK
jgi:hypothetical protein